MAAGGHHVEQLVAGVLGLGGHEADEVVALDLVQVGQQISKIIAGAQILAIGVDVLPQQGDLLEAVGHQLPHLVDDPLRVAAAFPAADVGHDAVGAEVVAAVHDGHPRAGAALADHWHTLGNGAVLILHGEHPAPLGIDLIQQLGELPQRLGAEHQIHMAVGLAHLLGHLRPLRHAAAQADHLRRVGLLRVGQGAQIAVHPLLRVVADGAGVQHHHVRLGRIVGERAPHSPEHTHDILAVGHVLLAAEGIHQRARGPVSVHFLQLCFKIPLSVQLRGGDLYLCSFQEDLPAPGGGEVKISWTV